MRERLADLARRIGARIVQLRKHGGWNQQQLAARAHISKAILSTIENGQRVPSVGLLHRLMSALGLPVDQALLDSGDSVLRGLWSEIYEGESPAAIQLRSGQDLKVQAVVDAELVPTASAAIDATPPGGDGGAARPDGATTASISSRTSVGIPAVEQLAALLGEQVMAQVATQVAGQVAAHLAAIGELHAQSVRNLTGVAHHLDRLEGRMERLSSALQGQAEALAALHGPGLRAGAAQVDAGSGGGSIGELIQRVEQLQCDFAEYQKSVRLLFLHSQHETQILRAEITRIVPLLRR